MHALKELIRRTRVLRIKWLAHTLGFTRTSDKELSYEDAGEVLSTLKQVKRQSS